MSCRARLTAALLLGLLGACESGDTGNERIDSAKPMIHTGLVSSSNPSGTSTTDSPLAWQFSGPIACENPSLRDEAKWDIRELGSVPVSWKGLVGSGIVVADLDGNNRLDIVRTSREGLQIFMQNASGNFSRQDGLTGDVDLTHAASGTAADFDGDGDKDLFIGRYGAPSVLLRSERVETGRLTFRDVSRELELDPASWLTLDSSWADIDLDGDLDLMVGNYSTLPPESGVHDPSRLYLNDDGTRFDDRSDWLPSRVQDAFVFMTGWHDVNNDLYPDLMSITDFFYVERNAILINENGTALTVDPDNNFQRGFNGMGLAVGDLNGDEVQDFAQSSTLKLSWLLSSPYAKAASKSLWIEHALSVGLTLNEPVLGQFFGWGTELGDLDNDTDLDLTMNWGFWDDHPRGTLGNSGRNQTDAMWLQNEDGTLQSAADAWGMDDTRAARGLIVADVNRDGWLDVVKAILDGPTLVYLSRCGDENWLLLRGIDLTNKNHDAVGSKVRVTVGDQSWLRWVHAGSTSMFSGGPTTLHFGLGEHDIVDRIDWMWPDGTVTTVTDVAANQNITARRFDP